MTRTIGCETARGRLSDYLDGELSTTEQVELDAHLRWCRTCGAHLDDLRLIGASVRLGADVTTPADEASLDGLQAGVMGRLEASRRMGSWFRVAFTEPKVLWACVGATVGVLACVLLTLAVASVVMHRRVEDSMATIIDTMSKPGSNGNPLALGGSVAPPRLAIPRLYDDSPELVALPQDDAMMTVATVVNREGRVSDYSIIRSNLLPDELMVLQRTLSNVRFAPAHFGGSTVAVNMVWVMARTTVRGSFRPFDFSDPRPRRTRNVG